MISVVDQKWVKNNFPNTELLSIEEFLKDEVLKVQTANQSEIEFDGVMLVNFGLNITFLGTINW